MSKDNELWLRSEEARTKLSMAKHLIAIYLRSREGLKELDILRSERSLQGDYAEWLVAHFLKIELSDNPVEKGFDARDADGKTYQIKSRVVSDVSANTSFDIRDIEVRFDRLIAVFFDSSFDVLAIIQVPYDVVKEMGSQTANRFSFRWNKKTAGDPRIEHLY